MTINTTGSVSPNGLNTLANQATGVATDFRQRKKQVSRPIMKLVLDKYRAGLNWRERAKDNEMPLFTTCR